MRILSSYSGSSYELQVSISGSIERGSALPSRRMEKLVLRIQRGITGVFGKLGLSDFGDVADNRVLVYKDSQAVP